MVSRGGENRRREPRSEGSKAARRPPETVPSPPPSLGPKRSRGSLPFPFQPRCWHLLALGLDDGNGSKTYKPSQEAIG